jgi:hypothetical protein
MSEKATLEASFTCELTKTIIATLLSRIASEKAKIKSVKLFFTLYRVLCPTAHSAFPQVLKSLQLIAHNKYTAELEDRARWSGSVLCTDCSSRGCSAVNSRG